MQIKCQPTKKGQAKGDYFQKLKSMAQSLLTIGQKAEKVKSWLAYLSHFLIVYGPEQSWCMARSIDVHQALN